VQARDGGPTPAPGWCDRPSRIPAIEGLLSQTCIFDTKRTNDDFQVALQTTPVPLRGTSPSRRGKGCRALGWVVVSNRRPTPSGCATAVAAPATPPKEGIF
jgi:hypothetical protein